MILLLVVVSANIPLLKTPSEHNNWLQIHKPTENDSDIF